jgi:hypothetical protein
MSTATTNPTLNPPLRPVPYQDSAFHTRACGGAARLIRPCQLSPYTVVPTDVSMP